MLESMGVFLLLELKGLKGRASCSLAECSSLPAITSSFCGGCSVPPARPAAPRPSPLPPRRRLEAPPASRQKRRGCSAAGGSGARRSQTKGAGRFLSALRGLPHLERHRDAEQLVVPSVTVERDTVAPGRSDGGKELRVAHLRGHIWGSGGWPERCVAMHRVRSGWNVAGHIAGAQAGRVEPATGMQARCRPCWRRRSPTWVGPCLMGHSALSHRLSICTGGGQWVGRSAVQACRHAGGVGPVMGLPHPVPGKPSPASR